MRESIRGKDECYKCGKRLAKCGINSKSGIDDNHGVCGNDRCPFFGLIQISGQHVEKLFKIEGQTIE